MKKGMLFLGLIIALVVIVGMWFVKTRNHMVEMEEKVNETWSQVENVYQRRLDLIPNLVQTVKGYAGHERETLESVIQARSNATKISGAAMQNALNDPQAFAKFQQAQGALSSALSRLMVVVERYPELKANKNFLELQSQLEGTENRIAVERRRFNEVAKVYNVKIRRWPDSFVASIAGFSQRPYFSSDAGAEKAPVVDFGDKGPQGQGP